MIQFDKFTGGVFDTNAFFVRAPQGNVLIDAPQGADARFATERIDLLLLTHGHFDHIVDVAAIRRRHGCRIAVHPDSRQMVEERGFFERWGFQFDIEPAQTQVALSESTMFPVAGFEVTVLDTPGHCPGSVCFYFPEDGVLFGGDVLFHGGIGRWDLPGGDQRVLLRSIREKLFGLPDETQVYPGHGSATTIGYEKRNNPFLA